MTKGRPFTDTEFKPNGRPFNDPTHPNYDKFNSEPEVEEPEVPVEDVDDEPIAEDPADEVIDMDMDGVPYPLDPDDEDPYVTGDEAEAEAEFEDSVDDEAEGEVLPEVGIPPTDEDTNAGEITADEDAPTQDYEETALDDGYEESAAAEPSPISGPVPIIPNGDPADDLIEEPPITNGDGLLVEEYNGGESETLETVITSSLVPEEDTITGNHNDESVTEDPLEPTISGTDAAEKIKGTRGDDILFGGLGADKFKVKKGDDIILDFQVGEDSLKGKFRDVELSVVDGSTLMDHNKGSVLFDGLELTAVDIFG